MKKILIIEDDKEISMLERDYLEISGFEVDIISDGNKAVAAALNGGYALILLDLMLPGVNGYDICREIRDQVDIPILMVTARLESVDKIRGLGIGANDYIAKPFDPMELVARIKSCLTWYERLTGTRKEGKEPDDAIVVGKLRILPRSWKVYKSGEEVRFSKREFELLNYLATYPDIVFSKDQLFERIWGYEYEGDSATVTVHINRIREKIEEDPSNPEIIETIWGAGYRLNK